MSEWLPVAAAGMLLAVAVFLLLPAEPAVWARRVRAGGGAREPSGGRFSPRPGRPWRARLGRLSRAVARHLPGMTAHRERLLVRAGFPGRLAGAVVVGQGLLGAILGLGLSLPTLGQAAPATTLLLWGVGVVLGWRLPLLWLTGRVEARERQIRRDLPDALDLLVLCAEGGDGLETALGRVARRLPGPLGDELGRVVEETRLGRRREEALRALADRLALPEVGGVVAALLQADRVGGSIAAILREQAQSMRTRRRLQAEAQAQQAAVKMLFPLVFCIFPALLVVVLGPAGLRIVAFFQTTGGAAP